MDTVDENELAKSAAPVPDNSAKQKPRKKIANPYQETQVWVKCVVEVGPWSGERPLEYWKDYKIDVDDALILADRKHVVILKEPKEK